ncbi:DNA-binding response regulator [Ralstonia solanacearum]|nr:DNA-binding response regulator [Ralstonia solanacearum]NKA73684.1 DNA-binding response regulator [Ralstonia solanacearum]NKA93094.1 DNA-binding response regulator [Ralstonia solanacearum]NKF93666.1 DNA-binding response regulator [Ralstonia solanacearum]NKG11034.1 DNA-binding response regulator [Ralstonia solanacearum]
MIGVAMKFAILTSKPASFAYVEACLSAQNVTCVRFDDALALLRARRTEVFDFLMIDAQLFSTAGRLVLSWRECNADMCWPTLVFGHFVERDEVRNIFDTGIDDFVAGHFSAEELCARVHYVLRSGDRKRQAADSGVRVEVGPYRLCRLTRTVLLHDSPIRLSAREFATAWLLFSSSGAFMSRQQIASAVWGTEASVAERSIEQHIYKLRKKLGLGEETGVEIKTVYSRGYQLIVQPTNEPSPSVEPPQFMLVA